MNGTVVRNIHRAEAGAIAALERIGVSTVHEAQGRTGLMQAYMRPVWRGARIAGSALTVLCHPNDNWMIHVAMEVAKPGDVLVVACSSENTNGAIGDLIATSLMARGVKGVVLDMGCRDVLELEQMKFPLWSRAISAQGTIKGTLGSVNFPVTCAGALVRPGDIVVADDDGVVVVPRQDAAWVIKSAEEREKKEAVNRERLKKGELTVDIYDMRKALAEKGLKYVDGPLE
jgi:4-hydroxy-4-methyl-2-oxoglutarate aldolase